MKTNERYPIVADRIKENPLQPEDVDAKIFSRYQVISSGGFLGKLYDGNSHDTILTHPLPLQQSQISGCILTQDVNEDGPFCSFPSTTESEKIPATSRVLELMRQRIVATVIDVYAFRRVGKWHDAPTTLFVSSFNAKLTTIDEQCFLAEKSPEPNSSSHSDLANGGRSVGICSKNTASKAANKKKRERHDADEEQPDEEEAISKPRKRGGCKSNKLLLACPFWKFDRPKHRKCHKYVLEDISRLK